MRHLLFVMMLSLFSWTAIAQPCNAIFTYTQQSGSSFQFAGTATGPGAITNYVWNFGDGSPASSLQSPLHSYAASGYYNVCLTVYGYDSLQNPFTCNYCDSVYAQSGSPSCNASFAMTNVGNTANFTNTSTATGTITNYYWAFGDGGNSTLANPSHTYSASGYYNVCLTIVAVSSAGTTQCYYCDSVYVGSPVSPCVATFTYNQTSGSSFAFFGAGSGPGAITNYVWNFGDGSPASSLQSPTHTYSASGAYNVCLTVYGYDSLQNPFTCTYCDSVYAQSGSPSCNASYTMTNTGNTANFTNTSTASGTITNYYWTFGDGGNSTLANPSHTYSSSGYYNVCLSIVAVSSAGTTQCYYCDSVYVGSPVSPCVATFTYNQTSGSSFAFFGAGSGPGTIMNYAWTFGDGGTSSLMSPTHTYANTGIYSVCLTVTGYDSLQNMFTCTYCDSVFAQGTTPNCNANFQSFNTGTNTVQFTDLSTASGTITNYYWTFGDGGNSTLANPTHTYATSGYYNVCLNIVAVSSAGTTQCNFCDSIYVNGITAPCAATFTYTQTSGSSFSFSSLATGPGIITNYAWTFGDGGTSTLANPTHNYTTGGIKTVCLTVTGYDSMQNMFSCMYCDSVYVQGGSGCIVTAGFTTAMNYLTANFTNTTTCPTCVSMNYKWTFGDGGTSTLQQPSHTYASGGSYNVCLVVTGYDAQNNQCVDSICNTILVNPSSISTVEDNQTVQIYPNPTQGTLTLNLPFTGDMRIKITDMTGQIVWMNQVNLSTPKHTLYLESLSKGIYIIQIQKEDKLLRANFSKQ